MGKNGKNKQDDYLSGAPRWVRYSVWTSIVSFLLMPFAGLANAILYMRFLSDRGVGLFGTPGWDLYWEYHTGTLGGTLSLLTYVPLVTTLLACGLFSLWFKLGDRA